MDRFSRLESRRVHLGPADNSEGSQVFYLPDFLSAERSQTHYRQLRAGVCWHQPQVRLFGKSQPSPRLAAWYGERGLGYRYSGHRYEALPWTAPLLELRDTIEDALMGRYGLPAIDGGHLFNSVLLNYYRNGRDSMGWHSDDEGELGAQPLIASLSLGQARTIRFRHRHRCYPSRGFPLAAGSLLVMAGTTQQHWHHGIPKSRRDLEGRINLTFRWVFQTPPQG